MRTAKMFTAAAAFAVIGLLSSTAMAVDFNVNVGVGWLNATGTCAEGGPCLGFTTPGAFAGSSLQLNWDNQTAAQDSFLRIGALPDDTAPFPQATGATTIAPGETVRTAQIQHENNVIPGEDDFLATITVRTLLEITGPGNEAILSLPLDVDVSFNETDNKAPCAAGSISVCDDIFTFVDLFADIPFEFEGVSYVLQIRGLVDANGDPACTDAGGGSVDCTTQEDQINDRFVTISLVQLAVPAPASLLLLGLGLVGAGVLPIIRKRLSA